MSLTHYTHMCMNCGPQRPTGTVGAPTTVVDGRCERCSSEAVTPIPPPGRDPESDLAAKLNALEVFHTEIVREKDQHIFLLLAREKDLKEALRSYREGHKKCVADLVAAPDAFEQAHNRRTSRNRRCVKCRRADELLRA